MRRDNGRPRVGWQRRLGAAGSGAPRWDESAHYVFTADEVAALRADAELLHALCLDAVDAVVTAQRYADFGLPEWVWPAVGESWRRADPHLLGRLDLRYDGTGPARLLEYDADTPGFLVEAAVVQPAWAAEVPSGATQFAGLHDRLVARWTTLTGKLATADLHFTWSQADPTGRDRALMGYLQETAAEAGANTVGLAIEQIGWDSLFGRFVDLAEAPMTTVVKRYPWEWLVDDEFGAHAVDVLPDTLWIEPLWKVLLSGKALLAVLWEMHPGHPNLLPAYLDQPGVLTEYVRKPKFGRDGENIEVVAATGRTRTAGTYGEQGHVYQLFDPLPDFAGRRPVVQVWTVGDDAAALGVVESAALVSGADAVFVPHRVEG